MPICLTCLESNANQPINSIHKTLNLQIRKVIEFCITIKLEINQNYPTAICTGCLSTLTFIYEFKQKVLENFIKLEKGLHSQLANKNVKEEPKDVKPIVEPIVEEVIISANFIKNEIKNEVGTNQAFNNDLVNLNQRDNYLKNKRQLDGEKVNEKIKTNKRYYCNKCTLSFNNMHSFKTHKNKVHPKWPFVCSTCHTSFKTSEKLETHQLKHTGEYMCEVCSKCFGNELALQQHSLLHCKNGINLKCKLCSSAFTKKSQYKKHIISHKTYSCMYCKKQFSDKQNFKCNTHTERPFNCEICKKGFFELNLLQIHYSKKHPDGV